MRGEIAETIERDCFSVKEGLSGGDLKLVP